MEVALEVNWAIRNYWLEWISPWPSPYPNIHHPSQSCPSPNVPTVKIIPRPSRVSLMDAREQKNQTVYEEAQKGFQTLLFQRMLTGNLISVFNNFSPIIITKEITTSIEYIFCIRHSIKCRHSLVNPQNSRNRHCFLQFYKWQPQRDEMKGLMPFSSRTR